jgi:inner membrane protein
LRAPPRRAMRRRARCRDGSPRASSPARFPDIDFVVAFIGPVEYLMNHRGATHSILLLPLWAVAVAWVLAKILREPRGWRALYFVSALGIAAHIAGDLITSYGTMILEPFSNARFAWGTTFIIDLWFTGIILAGLGASAFFYRSRGPSVVASLVLVGYVLFQAWAKSEALEFASRHAASLGRANVEITAYPRAVSPFNWTVYVSDDDAHRFAPRQPRAHASQERSRPGTVSSPSSMRRSCRWPRRVGRHAPGSARRARSLRSRARPGNPARSIFSAGSRPSRRTTAAPLARPASGSSTCVS